MANGDERGDEGAARTDRRTELKHGIGRSASEVFG
jgi:hypothetical protein